MGVRSMTAGLGVLTLLACGKGESKAGKSESAAAAVPPAAPAPAPAPGALTKPIAQYSGDEFYALTRQLQFGGGGEHQRQCRGRAGCRGASAREFTRIQVDGVAGDDSLSATNLPTNGAIAVRALNRGRFADSLYNMRPGAAYENYLIVLPTPNSASASWVLEELTTTAGSRTHQTIAKGTLRECTGPGHAFQRGPRADFKTCEQAAQVRPASFGAFLQGDIGPPIWFSCAVGCCTADGGSRS
jgi:hypothetical protein